MKKSVILKLGMILFLSISVTANATQKKGNQYAKQLEKLNAAVVQAYQQGHYKQGLQLADKAYQYALKHLGKEHPSTLISLNNLAGLYESQGRYGEAEPLYQKALQLREKVLGKEHPSTLISLNNLAALYSKQGRYGEAEPLYQKALQLSEKVLGKEHPDTLISLNNLAGLYDSQGRYGEAEPLYQKALQLREKVLGKEHPSTLSSLNNLALLFQKQGRYGEAEPLYQKALQLSEEELGKNHPLTLTIQSNRIILLINLKRSRLALRLLKQMEGRLFSRSFQELYSTAADRVRRLYLERLTDFQDLAFSLASIQPQPEYHKFAANVLLRWKQVYAEENGFQHRLMLISRDPQIIALRKKIMHLRAELGRQFHQPELRKDSAALLSELNFAETAIRQKAHQFKLNLEVSGAGIDQVLARLPADSALIEFRTYRPLDFKTGEKGLPHFAACLLLADIESERQLFFKDLGEITAFFRAYGESEKKRDAVFQFLLGSFEKQIARVKTLYIAPDGFLSLISFAALKLPDGRYLAERQQVGRLQTGRDLLASSSKSSSNLLVAFGGVDYGPSPHVQESESQDDSTPQTRRLNLRAAKELQEIKYLEQSLFEANTVAQIFRDNCKDGIARVYTQQEATEAQLKNMQTAPRILHLSTHGFFLENSDLKTWAEEAPLLLSGLALAGANRGLQGMTDKSGDDGLLYSIEALGLNLQGTQLVSLSACDTGKGVQDYSEGVYGLVRALRIAGAQAVLMTLRPVGDRSSRAFMEHFYETWLSAKDNPSPSEALHRTRLYFINHQNEEYRKPEVWSSYVLVGR